ncbi:family 43 glycosylhydrolase [Vibrio palustris]|uniref:Extracellular exo-alpha-(1->5)-L-arabinofuranosidase n=1 Tax=Vibrio palustris TaxID=1918946 RepID=A0A1R4B4X4_9VIBR|nr:family 43 glycosylhydrolase [Vibrio palustris]SJL83960.1 Extracellular exo-alpha-(1->5)-L-arabinofuranosidase precursor [Vibrio palustris]
MPQYLFIRYVTLIKTITTCIFVLLTWQAHANNQTFTNPVYANGADPWVTYFNGNYYSATTTWNSQLDMRQSPTLAGLADAQPVTVWSDTNPDRCCSFWAFEFHRLKGPNGWRWYMMYTSGHDENLDHQHLSVLESAGDDPMGPYEYKGSPMPNTWNIDGSYITIHDQLYLMYSQWFGDEQRNYIVKMRNPWTIDGQPALLSRPSYTWERIGRNVNEGPEPLIHNGQVYIVYSASYCETDDYKLGLLKLTGNDPMNPRAWTKYEQPVLTQANGIYGPGHNGFFTSPDGSENWIAYHGNEYPGQGCGNTRSLHAKAFGWNADGTPNFGSPEPTGKALNVPSGENGPLQVILPSPLMRFSHHVTRNNQIERRDSALGYLDTLPDRTVRITNNQGNFLTSDACAGQQTFVAWTNQSCQRWEVSVNNNGLLSFADVANHRLFHACNGNDCTQWSLSPVNDVAIISAVSGKAVAAVNGRTQQQSWTHSPQQIWQMAPQQDGAVTITNSVHPTRCLQSSGSLTRFGQCQQTGTHWYLHPRVEGGYRIVNKATGRLLDLSNCALSDGTSIGLYDDLDNDCQRFYLRSTR